LFAGTLNECSGRFRAAIDVLGRISRLATTAGADSHALVLSSWNEFVNLDLELDGGQVAGKDRSMPTKEI
jgi:hypothetical protein